MRARRQTKQLNCDDIIISPELVCVSDVFGVREHCKRLCNTPRGVPITHI